MMPESSHYVAGAGRLAYFGGDDGLGVTVLLLPHRYRQRRLAGAAGQLTPPVRKRCSPAICTWCGRGTTTASECGSPRYRRNWPAHPAVLVHRRFRLSDTSDPHRRLGRATSVVDVRTAKSVGRLTLPSTAQHQVSGSAVYSLTARRVCSCAEQPAVRKPPPARRSSVATSAGRTRRCTSSAPIRSSPQGRTRCRCRPPARSPGWRFPAGTTSWQRDGTGDPQPVPRCRGRARKPHHLRVAPDGSVTEYLKVKQKPLEVFDLTLAPTQVFGTLWGWQPERFKWGWGPLQQQWALSKRWRSAAAFPFAVSMVTGSRWISSATAVTGRISMT